MKKKQKRAIGFVLAILLLVLSAGCGNAEKVNDYPKRPVEMVIPFGAGGASDIFARRFADILKEHLGTAVTCVNKPSAGTIEGMAYSASQPKDGYLVMEITPSVLIKDVTGEFEFREYFEPVLKAQNDLMAFGVVADSPFNSMEELIAYAKEHPKELTIGGLSPGGLDDYIANGFALKAGYEWSYVPYKSGSEIKAAVLGGELDVYQDKLSSFLPLVESGDIKTLVVLNDERVDNDLLREVPCSTELGIDFVQGSWRGFCVAKGIPEEEKQILIQAFEAAYADPAYAELEREMKTDLSIGYMGAEEFGRSWDEECADLEITFRQMGLLDADGTLVASDIPGDILTEKGFPMFVLLVGILLLVFIFIQSWKKTGDIKKMFSFSKIDPGMLSAIIMLGLYLIIMNIVGFTLATLLFVFFNAWFMGYRNKKTLIIFTLIFTVVLVLTFGKVFYVPLPRGLGIARELSYLIY